MIPLCKEILWFDGRPTYNPDALVLVKVHPDDPNIWIFDPQEVQEKMDKFGEVWFRVSKYEIR